MDGCFRLVGPHEHRARLVTVTVHVFIQSCHIVPSRAKHGHVPEYMHTHWNKYGNQTSLNLTLTIEFLLMFTCGLCISTQCVQGSLHTQQLCCRWFHMCIRYCNKLNPPPCSKATQTEWSDLSAAPPVLWALVAPCWVTLKSLRAEGAWAEEGLAMKSELSS